MFNLGAIDDDISGICCMHGNGVKSVCLIVHLFEMGISSFDIELRCAVFNLKWSSKIFVYL